MTSRKLVEFNSQSIVLNIQYIIGQLLYSTLGIGRGDFRKSSRLVLMS